MYDENAAAYRVVAGNQRHVVIDDQQNEIVVCGDERNAEHYATLLTKAYQRGYKQGVRDTRSTQA